jgi:hypothetical protein
MNNKTLLNLTLVLAVGVVLILGQNLWSRYGQAKPNDYLKLIKKIKTEDVSHISIQNNGKILELTKNLDGWKVASKAADTNKIDSLLKSLFPKASPLLLAETSDQLQKLDLTNEKATVVSINTTDNHQIEFQIGKDSGDSNAVAIVGQSKAYSLPSIPSITANSFDWYDLAITDLSTESIKKITIENNGQALSLVSEKPREWKLEGQEAKVSNDAINTPLMTLNPLKANSIATENDKTRYNLNYPSGIITITKTNDEVVTLKLFQGEDDYLVEQTSPKNEFYILSKTKAEDILLSKDKILSTN